MVCGCEVKEVEARREHLHMVASKMVLTLAMISSPNALIKRGLASLSITNLRKSINTTVSRRTTEFSCETREPSEDKSRII